MYKAVDNFKFHITSSLPDAIIQAPMRNRLHSEARAITQAFASELIDSVGQLHPRCAFERAVRREWDGIVSEAVEIYEMDDKAPYGHKPLPFHIGLALGGLVELYESLEGELPAEDDLLSLVRRFLSGCQEVSSKSCFSGDYVKPTQATGWARYLEILLRVSALVLFMEGVKGHA
jgi:hypothetical protein